MPDRRIERPRFCAQCGAPVVVADANFCKNCGAPLTNTVWFNSDISWRPRVAAALSIVPGLGHWYKGERVRGLLWFIFVMMLYSSNAPVLGFLLHLICISNAGLGGAIREEAITNSTRRRHPRRRLLRMTLPPEKITELKR
ncbi:MAG: zinc ribbon domain-containing protein [Deltaproteobacteria bacterium]|nr:zinc ribbon domain-containing protein [Deltaproteobacteria bacterium]